MLYKLCELGQNRNAGAQTTAGRRLTRFSYFDKKKKPIKLLKYERVKMETCIERLKTLLFAQFIAENITFDFREIPTGGTLQPRHKHAPGCYDVV